jgi:excisionase family DNA binding protein
MSIDYHHPPGDDSTNRLMTVKEAAAHLGCSTKNVYALIQQGLLPVIQIGIAKGYRIHSDDLAAFLRERRIQIETAKHIKPPRPRLRHIRL